MQRYTLRSITLGATLLGLMMLLASTTGFTQGMPVGASTPPPTLSHELFLIVTGVVLGGALAPAFQIFDSWLGLTPGARLQRENYKVQREIAESLREVNIPRQSRGL
jgi:hypothetical protein